MTTHQSNCTQRQENEDFKDLCENASKSRKLENITTTANCIVKQLLVTAV